MFGDLSELMYLFSAYLYIYRGERQGSLSPEIITSS